MSGTCLIVSSIYDFSVDLVVQELEKRNIDYLRINKENLSQYEINLNPVKKEFSISGEGVDRKITKVKSIWFRQAVFLRNTPAKALSLEEQLSRSQWSAFLRGLMLFEDSYWMNWPASTYAAESKPYQLMIASEVGFKVPETEVGNSFKESKILNTKVIVKSLDTVLLRDGDDCLFTYTSEVEPSELIRSHISSAPLTVQHYINKKTDIRVTIVGDDIFAVKITSNGEGIDDDWRLTKRELIEYTDISLPDELVKSCKLFMRRLNLNFGAIDFIESNGEYYFIEINPTGEWGWLSNEKRAIEKYLADALSR